MKILSILFMLFSSLAYSATNFCAGKAANTFYCIDDTKMQHCTGNDGFVLKTCPAHLCATRTPANQNPCVGRDVAQRVDGVAPPVIAGGVVVEPQPAPKPGIPPVVVAPKPPIKGGDGAVCVGGPKFDPAGDKNVGNGVKGQFIGGHCLSSADCASGCCAGPCGICSGVGAQFQAGKTGCGFGDL